MGKEEVRRRSRFFDSSINASSRIEAKSRENAASWLTLNSDHGSSTVGRIAVGLDARLIRRSTGIHVRYILFFDLMRCVMRTVEDILRIVEDRQCQRSAVLFFGFLWKEQ